LLWKLQREEEIKDIKGIRQRKEMLGYRNRRAREECRKCTLLLLAHFSVSEQTEGMRYFLLPYFLMILHFDAVFSRFKCLRLVILSTLSAVM
jgi:hypothetical protein